MADTYTTAIRARKIEPGTQSDAHGTLLNEDVFDVFDQAIAQTQAIDLGSSTTYSLAALTDGEVSESRAMRLAFTGTPAGAVTVTVPASVTSKLYVVDNDCGQTLTIKYAATSGVAVLDNERHLVFANGTTVFALGAAIGAVQRNTYNIVGSVAGTNTITGSLSPTPNAYTAHMLCVLTPANSNTGATTLNLNSLGALDVLKADGDALVSGDLVAGVPAVLVLDTGADDWILLNPQMPAGLMPYASFSASGGQGTAIAGKALAYTGSGGHTLTLDNTLANESKFTLLNAGSGTLTVAAGGGVSLNWFNGTGTIGTGSRTLAISGFATVYKQGTNNYYISGLGLT